MDRLSGRRVGIIGTGATAVQCIPHLARDAGELVVFQRNAPWMLPTPRYYEPISAAHRLLLEGLPHYANWHRFYQVWASVEGRLDLVRVDPAWRHPVSVSAANGFLAWNGRAAASKWRRDSEPYRSKSRKVRTVRRR